MKLSDDALEKVIYEAMYFPREMPDYDLSKVIATAVIEAEEKYDPLDKT